jgi:hypothetical protein
MNLKELKEQVETIITNLRDHGKYPKENNLVDYKTKLNVVAGDPPIETFMKALGKDCISYANGQGGILLLGLKEIKATGAIEDVGLEQDNADLFNKLDLDALTKRFKKITGISFAVDIQTFTMSVRHFAYVLIPKSSDVLVPKSDFLNYGIKAGEITYRKSSTNVHANKDSADFNNFVQIKANEKSKEFMEIWSKLLPEIFDINPRDILIVNPRENTVYGYNMVDRNLTAGPVAIEQSKEGVVSIVLNAISAGEVGKISDKDGKPLYRFVGDVYQNRPKLHMTGLQRAVDRESRFKVYNSQLKEVMHHLGWVTDPGFKMDDCPIGVINTEHSKFIWIETTNELPKRTKVKFSPEGVSVLVDALHDQSIQQKIFGKILPLRKQTQGSSAKERVAAKRSELEVRLNDQPADKPTKLKQKTTKN